MNDQTPIVQNDFTLMQDVVDKLWPMHMLLDPEGRITCAGPALKKMLSGRNVIGDALFDVLLVRSPPELNGFNRLMSAEGSRLSVALKHADDLPLRGVIFSRAGGGAILNLSLGLSFARAVAKFRLAHNDFAVTDQTIELLYLNEANVSTTRLSEQLSQRLQAAHASAYYQARTDVLTGLCNRRALDAELEHVLAGRKREFTLLHLDLDLFKQVNDTHGHAAGDAVLIEVGRILNRELRRQDFPARVGGDEFMIILQPEQSEAAIAKIAHRLISSIERPIPFGDKALNVSASIGVVSTSHYITRPGVEGIITDVDEALYAAKRAGRGRFVILGTQLG